MEKLDRTFGSRHESVVDLCFGQHRTHRHRTACQAFGGRNEIRRNAHPRRREIIPCAPKTADHFIENQENAVLVADVPEALQVTFGWNDDTSGAGDRLDDYCRDRRRIVQRNDILQLVGEMNAPLWQAARVSVVLQIMGVRQMIHARQHGAEHFSVRRDAAY